MTRVEASSGRSRKARSSETRTSSGLLISNENKCFEESLDQCARLPTPQVALATINPTARAFGLALVGTRPACRFPLCPTVHESHVMSMLASRAVLGAVGVPTRARKVRPAIRITISPPSRQTRQPSSRFLFSLTTRVIHRRPPG